jgi:hypothetical protein
MGTERDFVVKKGLTVTDDINMSGDINVSSLYGRLNFKKNAAGNVNNDAIYFINASDQYAGAVKYFHGDNTLRFDANQATQLHISDGSIFPPVDNDVDLGTSSLKFKNSYFGLVDAENFKINGGQGSDGQVLTSTGSGVAWEDVSGGGGISNVVEDTSPQLGANLDTNSHNIAIDDAHGILDENSNEQLIFQTTANATSYLQVWNGISDSTTGTLFGNDVVSTETVGTGRMTGPGLEATGSTTDVGMSFKTKGLGHFTFFSDETSASAAPVINLMRHLDDNQIADDDILGQIQFMGGDDSMLSPFLHDLRSYAKIEANLVDITSASADGNLMFSALVANTHTDYLEVGSNKTGETSSGVASAGVRAYTGSMVNVAGTGTTQLERDTHAGAYVRATGAGTFTLWDNPKIGDQVVVISDHGGTTTIDGYSNDTINGAANTTITTQYNAKTFIATSTTTWIALG